MKIYKNNLKLIKNHKVFEKKLNFFLETINIKILTHLHKQLQHQKIIELALEL